VLDALDDRHDPVMGAVVDPVVRCPVVSMPDLADVPAAIMTISGAAVAVV
jgi:hypothetical protein